MLKPQDLAIAFKLVLLQGERLPYKRLAQQMHLSQFEAHAAIQRLMASRLVVDVEGQLRPVKSALRGFVLYGAPICLPAVRGEQTVGYPTSHGAAPLNEELVGTDESRAGLAAPERDRVGTGAAATLRRRCHLRRSTTRAL